MKRRIINRFYKLISWICGKKYSTHKYIGVLKCPESLIFAERAVSEKMRKLYPGYDIIWYLLVCNNMYSIIPDYV